MLKTAFQNLNLKDSEYQIFRTLYKVGPNPASVIAKNCNIERTTAYRILKKLNKLGLISTSTRQGIQIFYIEDLNDILKFVKKRQQELAQIEENYELITNELKSLRQSETEIPKIKIYDQGNKEIFNDILQEVKIQEIKMIRLIASNTLNERIGGNTLGELNQKFLQEIEKNNIQTETLIAEGLLTRERFHQLKEIKEIANLPTKNGASQIYIVGNTVFIIIFRETIIGLKISHSDIAQTLHFLFDKLQNKK